MKPGYKTSEFYMTLVGLAGTLAVSFGIFQVTDLDAFVKNATAVFDGVTAVFAIYKLVANYQNNRTQLKLANGQAVGTNLPIEEPVATFQTDGNTPPVNPPLPDVAPAI